MNETTDTGKTEREEKQKRMGFKWTKGRNSHLLEKKKNMMDEGFPETTISS